MLIHYIHFWNKLKLCGSFRISFANNFCNFLSTFMSDLYLIFPLIVSLSVGVKFTLAPKISWGVKPFIFSLGEKFKIGISYLLTIF